MTDLRDPATPPPGTVDQHGSTASPGASDAESVERRADRLFIIGTILCGSMVLGPIGLPFLIAGAIQLRRAQKRGIAIRPWLITVVAIFCLADGGVNFVAWALDIFPSHDSYIGSTFFTGFGKMFDGAYYVGYNTTALGGTAVPGEKALAMTSVLVIFPMRIAAAIGMLKMKQWGLHFMIVTSWMHLVLWLTYMVNVSMQFELRFGSTVYGTIGWWLLDVWFLSAIVMLPILYNLKRRGFARA